jgi:hypothetical protein
MQRQFLWLDVTEIISPLLWFWSPSGFRVVFLKHKTSLSSEHQLPSADFKVRGGLEVSVVRSD